MSEYASGAEFYDLLYAGEKDYRAEAELIAELVREELPSARSVLDVGCGTGQHARHLTDLGFRVDGVDLEAAFVERARVRCPGGTFEIADMTSLDLGRTWDVVTCLFSAIGYARTVEGLRSAVAAMARHLAPEGVLIVDPWFEPGQLTHGWVAMLTGDDGPLKVCRISRTLVEGRVSTLDFHYLIGRPDGVEHRTERHELGLFTETETGDAFRAAELTVRRIPERLRTRGIYVGRPVDGDRHREASPSGSPSAG